MDIPLDETKNVFRNPALKYKAPREAKFIFEEIQNWQEQVVLLEAVVLNL